MRIGVDATSLLTDQPRGEGKVLLRLYQEIGRLKPDWRYAFYGQEKGSMLPGIPNGIVRIFDIPGFRFESWENIGLPIRAWRDHVDVLHCSSSSAPWYASVPVVMTVHDIIPILMNKKTSGHEASRFRGQLLNGLRYARRIVAISESTKKDLAAEFHIEPERIEVIHWGFDSGQAAGDKGIKNSYKLPAEVRKPYIFGFGGIVRKNPCGSIKAFKLLAETMSNIHLVIAGMTDEIIIKECSSLIASYNLEGRVTLLGYIDDTLLQALYAHAECFLYPSFYEGFGLPPLDAMAKEVPVVASNIAAIAEVSGDAAVLVDPTKPAEIAHAIKQVLQDGALRSRLKTAGKKRVATFSWEKAARAYIDVFEKARKKQT